MEIRIHVKDRKMVESYIDGTFLDALAVSSSFACGIILTALDDSDFCGDLPREERKDRLLETFVDMMKKGNEML